MEETYQVMQMHISEQFPPRRYMLSQMPYTNMKLQPLIKRALYYGTSDGEFKNRFNNDTRTSRHESYSTDTELSKYIWKLSNDKIQCKIKYNIEAYASPYKCGSKRCDLCLTKKLKIMRVDHALLLNKPSESES